MRKPFVAVPWELLEWMEEFLEPLYERLFVRLLRQCRFQAGWIRLRRGGAAWLDAGETLFASASFGPRHRVDRQTALRFRKRLERLGVISIVPRDRLALGPAREASPGATPVLPGEPLAVPLGVPLSVPISSVVRVEKCRRILWPSAESVPLAVPLGVPKSVPVLPSTRTPEMHGRPPSPAVPDVRRMSPEERARIGVRLGWERPEQGAEGPPPGAFDPRQLGLELLPPDTDAVGIRRWIEEHRKKPAETRTARNCAEGEGTP